MCETCGCATGHDEFTIHRPDEEEVSDKKSASAEHEHHNEADHSSHKSRIIHLETDILSKNNLLAERNRGYFQAKKIKAFNLVSSPGSGKTTLLEKLIPIIMPERKVYVIEGDQQTSMDSKRITITGAVSIQINTGNGCHLDAHMINHVLLELNPQNNSLLFIENVGNLVCPALFDLGETERFIIASVTEGEDKPLKYPSIFQSSHVCVLNKIDLSPYVDFNKKVFLSNLNAVNPNILVKEVSAKTGDGLKELAEYFLAK